MLDPDHQSWRHESTKKLGRSSFRARLICARARSVEKADDVHEVSVEIRLIDGGWSAEFFCSRGLAPVQRAAAAAAYLTAWAFARLAFARELADGVTVDASGIPRGIVSFGDGDVIYARFLIEAYFGIQVEALREQPRKLPA